MRKSVLAIALCTAVVIPSSSHAQVVRPWSFHDAIHAAGQQLFQDHCGACHGRDGVAKGYAPSLKGVIGRQAGTLPGFPFSPQLKNSGIVWTDANIVKWIANAPAMVPGTPMPHVSISDPVERRYVYEYLKSLDSERAASLR
jgi:cytochrome c